jgi:acetoacetyl-CoA synthetase
MEQQPLWQPSAAAIAALPLTRFTKEAEKRSGRALPDYRSLHAWSVADPAGFWDLVWDFTGVIGEKGSRRLIDGERMPGARFFPDAQLNFAENLLRRNDDGDAIVFRGEDGATRRLSWRQLSHLVSRLQQALAFAGVGVGDRVAAFLPNIPEAVAAMLATASLGAVWSSASPDFGVDGVVDRFGQIAPTVFITADGYHYAGKTIDLADKVRAIVPRLPGVRRTIVVPVIGKAEALAAALPEGMTLDAALTPFAPRPVTFARPPSRIRCTFSFHRARRVCRSASCTPPAERCSSISRSISSTRRSARTTGCSISPPLDG